MGEFDIRYHQSAGDIQWIFQTTLEDHSESADDPEHNNIGNFGSMQHLYCGNCTQYISMCWLSLIKLFMAQSLVIGGTTCVP